MFRGGSTPSFSAVISLFRVFSFGLGVGFEGGKERKRDIFGNILYWAWVWAVAFMLSVRSFQFCNSLCGGWLLPNSSIPNSCLLVLQQSLNYSGG